MAPASKRLKILIAPLDWGLGHTTRCVPIINELIKRDTEVFIAGNHIQQEILAKEFPQCHFLHVDGYNVRYNDSKTRFAVKMLSQVPAIISRIRKEYKWLIQVVKFHKIDGVISDNRFGLFSETVPCAFITHQLNIKTAIGVYADKWLQRLNYSKINKYTYCWIPDYEHRPDLAGDLSHPERMPAIQCSYIGPLSRLTPFLQKQEQRSLLFIISGPEPQRSIFEKIIFSQVEDYKGPVTIVRGLPAAKGTSLCGQAKVYNHLSKDEMNRELKNASYVICRSGYSSVMDINATNARAILVPTPGQTEQEYLAAYLMKNKFALSCRQGEFDLKEMLQKADDFSYAGAIPLQPDLLQQTIEKFLQHCETRRAQNLTSSID